MRCHRSGVRYAMLIRSAPVLDPFFSGVRVRLLPQGRWTPDADVFETRATVEVIVDLAGVDDEDFEVHLFEDALVVQGHRRLPGHEEAVYHAAGIRQGPFEVVIPLPAAVDAEGVEMGYDRGLLRVTLPRRA